MEARATPPMLFPSAGGSLSRRRVVPAETIQEIDGATGVVGLNVERESIRAFL